MSRVPLYIEQNYRELLAVLLCVAGAVAIAWVVANNPLQGSVSATVINTDGSTRALEIDVAELTARGYTYRSEQLGLIIAAVPNPQKDRTAFVVRTRDGKTHVSVGDTDGQRSTAVHVGTAGIPSWSMDGRSIAVSVQDTEGDAGTPESWTVLRAVTNGDSLPIGKGYRPFPSQNQRTFALTSQGIALLSYRGAEPKLVVASPKNVPISTPFAVSQDGTRVAWVAPADNSLQVYENVNGYFVPLLLSKDVRPESMVFSPTGKHLLGTIRGEATTTLQLITVDGGKAFTVGEWPGFLKLHTWLYEE